MELRTVFGQVLLEIVKENEKVVVLDADLNSSLKTDVVMKHYPNRFVQLGIAEQNLFGWSAGLATLGFIPFPTTFASFAATRALDQIRISIAYPKLNVKIAGSYPGISSEHSGPSHACIEDLAIMRSLPNMRVLDPADEVELRQVMYAVTEYVGPVYFRVTKFEVPKLFDASYRFDWNPVLLRPGDDVALVGTGYMTHKCVQAAELLGSRGISAAVVHVPCLKPLDGELLSEIALKTRAIVTAENHNVYGGLGDAVCGVLAETVPCLVERVGIKDTLVMSGNEREICREYGLTPDDIVAAAMRVIDKK